MGIYYCTHLEDNNCTRTIFRCENCRTDLFSSTSVTSDNFTGKYGQAFFVNKLVNFKLGCQERRDMMTGSYIVRDAKCHLCDSYIGWKYVEAENYEEKYKEGNFVIELEALDKDHTRYMKKRINELFK